METRNAGPSRSFVVGHLLTCSIFWASSFLFIKLVDGALQPVVLASVRALIGAATIAVIVLMVGQTVVPKGREWFDWAVLGTLNGWIPNILVTYALTRMDSGPAALVGACSPLLTAGLSHFLLADEKLTPMRVFGILIGLLGMGFLIGPSAFEGGAEMLASLAMITVALCYSLGNVYTRSIPAADPLRLAFGQQAASALFATSIALGVFGVAGYSAVPSHIPVLLALGVLATALPIWSFMRLIVAAGPTRAVMSGYLVPTAAFVMGVLILSEPVLPRQLLGGAIVLFSVAIVTGLIRLPSGKGAGKPT